MTIRRAGILAAAHELLTAGLAPWRTSRRGRARVGIATLAVAYVPFDDATLQALYPTHGDYIDRVTTVTNQTVRAGFVLPPDADETIADAKRAKVPPRP